MSALPVRAVLLARRVRVLVGVTLLHTVTFAALAWSTGRGVTGPGAVGFGVHVAVSLAAALPVWWQFAGDPTARQRRAVRAMAVSFAGLAAYSALDAVHDALARPSPGEPVVGAVLALVVVVALAVLAVRERREADHDADTPPIAAGPLVVVIALLLPVAAVADLLTASTFGGPAVSASVGLLAVREAVRAWSWAGVAGPRGAVPAAPGA